MAQPATLLPVPHVIFAGDTDKAAVLAVQKRLNRMGCGPIEEDGDF